MLMSFDYTIKFLLKSLKHKMTIPDLLVKEAVEN